MKTIHKEMLLASLEKFNSCDVTVGGTSMWPFIKSGDTVLITKKNFKPSLGKVVAFFIDDQLITHRIIWYKKKDPEHWDIWVHGDGCPHSVSKIDSNQIIGTVKHIKRKNRIISRSFNDFFRYFTIPIGFLIQMLIAFKSVVKVYR